MSRLLVKPDGRDGLVTQVTPQSAGCVRIPKR